VLSRHQTSLGQLAVAVFFVASGFLVTSSWQHGPQAGRFVSARALRLYPALIIMLFCTTFVLGPWLSSLSIPDYFADGNTLRFFWANLSLTTFVPGLPGVFESLPFAGAVNGSLWTLQYEVACYGAVLLLGAAGLLNRWVVTAAWIAGCLARTLWWGGPAMEFGTLFLAGAALQLWNVRMDGRVAGVCLAVLVLALTTGGLRLALPTAGAYVVLYAALGLQPWTRNSRADLSYGTYIWAFPVQQMITEALGPMACWWLNIALSAPLVLALSWLSWRWVEAPALLLKGARPSRRQFWVAQSLQQDSVSSRAGSSRISVSPP